MFVRKKEHHGGGSVFYQLVESRRVEGRPRQRVVMHLGHHATVDGALEEWPKAVGLMRRRGYTEDADGLKAKLDRLRGLREEGTV